MKATKSTKEKLTSLKVWSVSTFLTSAVGLAASLYLALLHWKVHNVPGHTSFCAINSRVNCDTVAMSKYSIVAGLPLAHWGVMFYGLILVLLAWGLQRRTLWPFGLVNLLHILSVGVSIYLALLSEMVIQSYCLMCITLYLVNLTSAILCVFGQRKIGISVWAGTSLLLLSALVSIAIFVSTNFACIKDHIYVLWATIAGLLALLIFLNTKNPFSIEHYQKILKLIFSDLRHPFRRRAVGIGITLCGLSVPLCLLIAVPYLYRDSDHVIDAGDVLPSLGVSAPCEAKAAVLKDSIPTLAGGLNKIEHGTTEEGFHWIGAAEPKIVITEYSDYECPYCRQAHEIVREVVREKKETVRLVHVQMPLDHTCNKVLKRPFHKHACDCALAAICASKQSAFWPMNDQMFIRRCQLEPDEIVDLAESMGMEKDSFQRCMKSVPAKNILKRNLQECKEQNLKPATPVFKIRDQIVVGLKDRTWWLRTINQKGN